MLNQFQRAQQFIITWTVTVIQQAIMIIEKVFALNFLTFFAFVRHETAEIIRKFTRGDTRKKERKEKTSSYRFENECIVQVLACAYDTLIVITPNTVYSSFGSIRRKDFMNKFINGCVVGEHIKYATEKFAATMTKTNSNVLHFNSV